MKHYYQDATLDFQTFHFKLLFHRVRILLLKDQQQTTPFLGSKELLKFVFDSARQELRVGANWHNISYTVALTSLRGPLLDQIVEDINNVRLFAPFSSINAYFINQNIKNNDTNTAYDRDKLRRLLTHILQKTRLTPQFLTLNYTELEKRKNVKSSTSEAMPVAEGAYSTVYIGYLKIKDQMKPKKVAIKTLKYMMSGTTEQIQQRYQVYHLSS